MASKRVAFITVGQSPRVDIMPEMLGWIGGGIEAVEMGLLDGMSPAEIAALEPTDGEHRIVSRLSGGGEAAMSQDWVERRFQAVINEVDGQGFDLIVLLCTGSFPTLVSRTLMVEAGRIVNHMVDALAEGGRTVGMMVPDPSQVTEFARSTDSDIKTISAHASPYSNQRFAAAVEDLGETDFIVMHCMGYDRSMRDQVAAVSGRPVLLSRGVVAAAIAQLI